MGQIRLACRFCDRDDCDFINDLPADWCSVEEVQDYEASLREALPSMPEVRIFEWFTHLGVCPDCYEAEIRAAIAS